MTLRKTLSTTATAVVKFSIKGIGGQCLSACEPTMCPLAAMAARSTGSTTALTKNPALTPSRSRASRMAVVELFRPRDISFLCTTLDPASSKLRATSRARRAVPLMSSHTGGHTVQFCEL